MTMKGIVRGRTIELASTLPYPDGQEMTINVVAPVDGLPAGSPHALLAAIRKGPHVDSAIVDELERTIEASKPLS